MRTLAPTLALLSFACGDPTGTLPQGQPFDAVSGLSGTPIMDPGTDCIVCHSASGNASFRPWTVAGTVYGSPDAGAGAGLAGVSVLLTDVNGVKLTLQSNAAGNFYTAQPLGDLADIEVQEGDRRLIMQTSVVGGGSLALLGSCNRCHQEASASGVILGISGAPGRLYLPPP
ncbi:MAG: hypothetical protein ACYCWW_10715 [Deltaproteobacteria bacterium]